VSLSTITHGRGYPVVVLPGLGLDARFTAAVTEPVMAEGVDCRRIYVSLPGAGSSASCEPSSDAILDVLTDWVETELGTEPFALVGYSYGGYLAAALAQRLQTQVRRLLLVCSGVKIDPSRRDLSDVLPPDTEPGWLDSCPASLHEHLTVAVGRQHRVVGDRLAAAFTDSTAADNAFLTGLRTRYQLTCEQSLTPLDLPVTFVAGRRDQIAGFRDQFDACLDCPQGDYQLFASAGHYLPAEVPVQFRQLVTSWLRR
jgi:pimeloyl-ACP methyl ester carboxylesterase